MKIHTVELPLGEPGRHEVVLLADHGQALAKMLAERNAAQAQLEEAVKLIRYAKDELRTGPSYGWEDRLASQLGDFLARNAQAEQQEALGAQAVDERAAFEEAWIKLYRIDVEKCPEFHPKTFRTGTSYQRKVGGDYIGSAWWGWQARAALATQPAAGEPVEFNGKTVADRLDQMADAQPSGSSAQSDLYAAATAWRKHLAPPAAAPVAGGEPIHQWQGDDEWWIDCSLGEMKAARDLGSCTRIVYKAPPAAAHGDEAVHVPTALASRIVAALESSGLNADYRMAGEIRELIAMRAQVDAHADEADGLLRAAHQDAWEWRKRAADARKDLDQAIEMLEKGVPYVASWNTQSLVLSERMQEFVAAMRAQAGEGGE